MPARPQYPALKAFHAKVAELPALRAYLASAKRPERCNNNNLG